MLEVGRTSHKEKSSVGLAKPESIGLGLLSSKIMDVMMWHAKRINRRVWGEYDRIVVTVGWIGGFPMEADSFVTDVASSKSRILGKRRHG